MLTEALENELYSLLGSLIKEARNNADIKQELLADYLGLSRVSISNIENGKQNIQVHTLLEVAKYLGVNVSDFLEPLNKLLVNNVSSSEEKKIIKGAEHPKQLEGVKSEEAEKIKEFINFLKIKKG